MKLIDLSGSRFGRLVVLKRADSHDRRTRWLCRCDCGEQLTVVAYNLRNGNTGSCGCLQRDRASEANTTHGMVRDDARLYHIWKAMQQRCDQATCKSWNRYGGRGIRVCDEWRDAATFAAWAHANGYRDDLTLDRIDNDGNYEPANCRWVTITKQLRNTSRSRLLTYRGKTRALVDWADLLGIDRKTLWSRLYRYGWPIERALEAPVRGIRS